VLSNHHALLDPLQLLHLQAQAGHLLLQVVPRSLHQDSPPHGQGPKEVLNLFTEQLKAVFKNYNFQENLMMSLLEYN
jgi:hypothetical protein